MAYEETSVAARTFQELANATRRMLGDESDGINDARWTLAEVLESINFEINKMSTQMGITDPGSQLSSTTMTYTSDTTEVTLPQAAANGMVYMVQNETESATRPIQMQRISFQDINTLGRMHDTAYASRYVWTHIANNQIAVRPLPSSDLTLRVFYIHNPRTLLDSDNDDSLADETLTDQHIFYAGHEELICLGAAIRLKRVDDEQTNAELMAYRELWDLFMASHKRNRGPTYVRSNRRWH